VLPLPASGRFGCEPDEHTLLLAYRLHARIAHPVHAAALALRILTGHPVTRLPRSAAPGANTQEVPGSPAQTPAWAAGLIEAGLCFGDLDRLLHGEGPVRLSSWDQEAVTEAARTCALHEPPVPGPRRGRAHSGSTRPKHSTPTTG
jgi:hypothetical protein